MLSGITAPRLARAPRGPSHAPRYSHALPDARACESSPLCRAADAATDAAALLAGALACPDVPTRTALSRTAAGALWDASLDCLRGSRTADAGSLSRAACLASGGRLADASMLLAWVLPSLVADALALRDARARLSHVLPAPTPDALPSPSVVRARVLSESPSKGPSGPVDAFRGAPATSHATPPARPAQPRDARGRFVRRA